MFLCTKQPKRAKKGKAFRYPGPDDSHLSPCHNAGAEVVEVHCLYRLPGTQTSRILCKYRIKMREKWRVKLHVAAVFLCMKDHLLSCFILFHQFPSQIHLSACFVFIYELTYLFWWLLTPFCMRDSLLALYNRLSSLLVAIEIVKAISRSFSIVQCRSTFCTNLFISALKSSTSATRDDADILYRLSNANATLQE